MPRGTTLFFIGLGLGLALAAIRVPGAPSVFAQDGPQTPSPLNFDLPFPVKPDAAAAVLEQSSGLMLHGPKQDGRLIIDRSKLTLEFKRPLTEEQLKAIRMAVKSITEDRKTYEFRAVRAHRNGGMTRSECRKAYREAATTDARVQVLASFLGLDRDESEDDASSGPGAPEPGAEPASEGGTK